MSRKLANGERQIDNVARIMDGWVDNHPWARGGWVPADQDWDEFTSNQTEGDVIVNPIQQVRDEVLGLCEVLLDTNSCETAVINIHTRIKAPFKKRPHEQANSHICCPIVS